ncbi:MAG: DUF3152 domain-containing protein [Actinomycetes bacterium]
MQTRESRARARRRVIRRRRQVASGGLALFVVLLVLAGFRLAAALTDDGATTGASVSTALTPKPEPHAGLSSTPTKSLGPKSQPSASPPVTAPGATTQATGQYLSALGGSDRHGLGVLKTYAVQVETGTGQDTQDFAAEVDATLADPASWTGQGRWSLQRVSANDADFVIRLATPATVDKVCATAGLNTRGYVSCRAGNFVMLNLDRWLTAIPDYDGDVALYRKYVVNHEVGHQLGYNHVACPGQGRLAPVMQQQTFGLDGCRANGSPYLDGVLVSGPAVP